VPGTGDRDERPLGLPAFDELADEYAERVLTKAHNAYYERPATLSLLPDVGGKRVLDAGCGPGIYAEKLLECGAELSCFDVSKRMVELAIRRLAGRAPVRVADMNAPLDFLEDASFDIVLSALDHMLEPLPTPEFEAADPGDYVKLQRRPGFLCLRMKRVKRT